MMAGPKLVSIVVADDIRQETNGKYLIVGSYLEVRLDYVPEQERRSIFVVSTITGVPAGRHSIRLRIADLNGKRTFEPGPDYYESTGEDAIGFLIQELKDFYFPTVGSYRFSLLLEEEELGALTINVWFPTPAVADVHVDQSGARATKKSRAKKPQAARRKSNL